MLTKIISFFIAGIMFLSNLVGINFGQCSVFEDISYGEHERQKLDLYIPKNTDGEAGLILMIHGGGWIAGDKSCYADIIKEYSEKYGYVTASVNYRYLSFEVGFDDILDDIETAVDTVKQKAAENGVAVNKMLLSGHSAGGHLSLLYAYSRKDSSSIAPAAVVDFCGPCDLTDPNYYNENSTDSSKSLYTLIASLTYGSSLTLEQVGKTEEKLKKASPIYYIDENTVPTVINHGVKDDIVPFSNAASLEAKLSENGVTHVMNTYPNSGHSLSNNSLCENAADDYFYLYAKKYLK